MVLTWQGGEEKKPGRRSYCVSVCRISSFFKHTAFACVSLTSDLLPWRCSFLNMVKRIMMSDVKSKKSYKRAKSLLLLKNKTKHFSFFLMTDHSF